MPIFGFFFIILLVVVLVVISIIGSVFRLLFGFGRRGNQQRRTYTHSYRDEESQESHHSDQKVSQPRKKIFDDDEGEYVDYEEVKDDDK